MIANRMRLHWQRNKDHGEKLGLSANGRKNNIRGGGGVPKCSEIKKQVHAIFLPGLQHASFGPICGHVRMSKNAMRADLSRQMKKKNRSARTHPAYGGGGPHHKSPPQGSRLFGGGVGVIFADWNAPALGGILDQQGVGNVGNSTTYQLHYYVI
jgi:hypothetical protein